MTFPADLLYHPDHVWVRREGAVGTFGVSSVPYGRARRVVRVDLPVAGAAIARDEPYARVEATKAASDVIAPMSGDVVEVNRRLEDEPHLVNRDPYGDGWLVRARLRDPAEAATLLDAEAYADSL
jgi:glycine cleavage system H protein